MGQNPPCHGIDHFKLDFKYYKQKASNPSFDDILNFEDKVTICGKVSKICIKDSEGVENIQPPHLWKAYEVKVVPGLYFVTDVFSNDDQKYWGEKCLQKYTKSPYVTNLDAFQDKNSVDQVWKESKSSFASYNGAKDVNILKTLPIWNVRWSTLGYHHDWDSKHYRKDFKSAFPSDLGDVCRCIAKTLGFEKYRPEAAITNFYHVGSTLAPHKDISEADLSLPLISISFGLDAIFLIGGDTKDKKPIALLIRSGDVIIMSGECRTAYHGLPRIMPSSRLILSGKDDDFLSFYLQHSRINLNVRQVESDAFVLS